MAKKPKGNTVLIVEDDTNSRTFVCRLLELEDYQVLQTEKVDEASRLMRENKVNLVLLDLRLADNNGWMILAQMKSDPALSAMPVIVFTASFGIPQKERALAMGAADYLIKPLSVTVLKDAVARALKR